MDCLSWVPGSGLLLSGLARKDVAVVRIELVGRPPLLLSTLGRDKPVQLVAFASPSSQWVQRFNGSTRLTLLAD
jgi:hypothetical protein